MRSVNWYSLDFKSWPLAFACIRWFWIDPVADLAFVGMVQHDNLATTRAIHGLSRSLVYQAVME